MKSKVLLLGQIEYIRELYDDGIRHGMSEGEAWVAAMDHAEEIAEEDNPISAMIFGNIDQPGTLSDNKVAMFPKELA